MRICKKCFIYLIAAIMFFCITACENNNSSSLSEVSQTSIPESVKDSETRIVTDSSGRKVEIPSIVRSIVCVNVGALRYTCYMQAQDLVVGVEDYEQKATLSRLYNYVNFDKFSKLPVIGTNGEHYSEAIIEVDPDVIIMTHSSNESADALQYKTGIAVVLVPGSDTVMDDGAYETLRIMGKVFGKERRVDRLTAYLHSIKEDIDSRTADIKEGDKLTVYVAGVSYKGIHGLEGTEANYGPLSIIHARNLANETGQTGPFNIDIEKILVWDPDYIFVDLNGIDLINEDYVSNPDYYNNLTAVKEGRVYSQISYRSSAANLETALANAYYAGTVIYPEQFKDIDPIKKTSEIFETFLGINPYNDLKEAGYEFRPIIIGE